MLIRDISQLLAFPCLKKEWCRKIIKYEKDYTTKSSSAPKTMQTGHNNIEFILNDNKIKYCY